MNALATTPDTEAVLLLDLTRIRKSKSNPRRRRAADHAEKIQELADSITKHGVLEPVIVRPLDKPEDGYDHELVVGSRRYDACSLAAVGKIPALVRDLSDDDVLEIQVIENAQRVDVHPLDEADAFQALVKRNYPTTKIAEKIGRPLAYVVQRLKLCSLSKRCRAALDEEKISIGVAVLLARLPTEKLQDEALEHVDAEGHFGQQGLMSVADARKEIEENVMVALKGAPFDQADGKLVPKAGPCTTCPKRTGVQTEMFADASSPDLCTDPPCFKSKLDALWQIRTKEHRAAGGEVLTQADSKKLFGHSYNERREIEARYAKLDDSEYIGNRSKKLRSLFGKELPPITLARDPETGLPIELVPRKEADAVIRAAKKEKEPAAAATPARSGPTAAEKRKALQQRARAEAVRRALAKMVAAAEKALETNDGFERVAELLVGATIESVWSETGKAVCERRGLEQDHGKKSKSKSRFSGRARADTEELLTAHIAGKTGEEKLALVFELLVLRSAPSNWGSTGEPWKKALSLFKVDFSKLEREVAAELQAKAKERQATKKTKPKGVKANAKRRN